MMDDTLDRDTLPSQRSTAKRRRWWFIWLAVILLLATILVPPFINIGRFKSRITQAISTSLDRPVRLSSVELRLFPWPSFELTNLSVAEDPAYGAEPVLHADTVRADLSIWSLWRGKIAFSSIHVDNASLNLERAAPGRWNLDPLFRTAASHPGSALRAGNLPYLEATNSRINIKDGAEKLPFSLINTDLSFWQASPGDWRVRLRGQPARTDVALELGDTGIVRLEASLRRAPELRNMPVHLDLDWREAQLGALARLLTGSDTGWRGDLTGEAHIDGTPGAARVSLRLSAAGVHRAEFAPPASLDFDANCAFTYDYARRALEKLNCDSPLGDGHLRLSGDVPGTGQPDLTLQLDQVPAGAGLDLLRTMRSGFAPSLEASGTISGKLDYAAAPAVSLKAEQRKSFGRRASSPSPERLSGSLTVQGFSLNGGALSEPLRASRIVFEPSATDVPGPEQSLVGTAAIEAGGSAPLEAILRLGSNGYQIALHGPISLERATELGRTAGLAQASALDDLFGTPALLNLTAQGPWIKAPDLAAADEPDAADGKPRTDSMEGTATLHEVRWHSEFLAADVSIAEAVVHFEGDRLLWSPIAFSYGPVKGSAAVTIPVNCQSPPAAGPSADDFCEPQFALRFTSLDVRDLQSAFLGAPQGGTLLDSLIDRFRSSSAPAWPPLRGSIDADSLELGPFAIHQASAQVKVSAETANLSGLQGSVLGGQLHGKAAVSWAGAAGNQPSYVVDGDATGLAAPAVGHLLGVHWTGGPLNLNGKIELSGFKAADLADSAKGTMHFTWKHGGVTAAGTNPKDHKASPLAHFNVWSGELQIANGVATLEKNELVSAGQGRAMHGDITLTKSPKVQLAAATPVSR